MQLLFFDLVPIEDPSLVVSPRIGAGPRLESGGTISAVVDFLGDKLLLRSSSLTFSAPLCAFRSCVRRVNRDVANDVSHRLSRSKASGVAMAMIDDLVQLDRQGQKVRADQSRSKDRSDEGRLEAWGAVDFDTGGVVATPAHLAAGGATTPAPTMAEAHENLAAVASCRRLRILQSCSRPSLSRSRPRAISAGMATTVASQSLISLSSTGSAAIVTLRRRSNERGGRRRRLLEANPVS